MDPVIAGGLIGGGFALAGTLFSPMVQRALDSRRDQATTKERNRRAVIAVRGELLEALGILVKAAQRDAWWPGRAIPRRAFDGDQHQDALLDALDSHEFELVKITYSSILSLRAIREQLLEVSRPLLGRAPYVKATFTGWDETSAASARMH